MQEKWLPGMSTVRKPALLREAQKDSMSSSSPGRRACSPCSQRKVRSVPQSWAPLSP